jgi:hypothetical protein
MAKKRSDYWDNTDWAEIMYDSSHIWKREEAIEHLKDNLHFIRRNAYGMGFTSGMMLTVLIYLTMFIIGSFLL